MIRWYGVYFAAFLIGWSVYPAWADDCVAADTWQQNVVSRSVGMQIIVLNHSTGIDAKSIVARLNAMPPETNLDADEVVILGAKDPNNMPAPYFLVAFFKAGCIVTSGRARPDEVEKMLHGADGEPS